MATRRCLVLAAVIAACGSALSSAAWAQAEAPPPPPPPSAPAVPGSMIDATLSTGETIRGELVSEDETVIIIKHPVMGQVTLPKSQVKGMVATPPPAPPPPPVPPPPMPPPPDPTSFFEGWTGSIFLGIGGAEGNSERFNATGGIAARRQTSETVTLFNVLYTYASADGEQSENRGELNLRNDWRLNGGPWRFYALGRVQYDTFQDWEWRLSAYAGFGYELIKDDNTLLLPRLGVGASQELGGPDPDNRTIPELNIGLDFEHKFDERNKMFFSVDYYPSLLDFNEFRLWARAGYEVVVDPTNKLSLRLGVEDNYQSDPGPNREKNDITYFLALSLGF